MADNKVKPVTYKGEHYDSTTEGRVAVLLDSLGAIWEREPVQENGFMPDFRIQKVKTSLFECEDIDEIYIEVKGAMRSGWKSDAEKLMEFTKDHLLLVINHLPMLQGMVGMETLAQKIIEESDKPLPGENPFQVYPWTMMTVDPMMLVVKKDRTVGVMNCYEFTERDDWKQIVDEKATVEAYRKAAKYKFESTVAQMEQEKELLEKENQELKEALNGKPIVVSNKRETKSKRRQIVLRPSTDGALKDKAKELMVSVNDLVNQVLEHYLWHSVE